METSYFEDLQLQKVWSASTLLEPMADQLGGMLSILPTTTEKHCLHGLMKKYKQTKHPTL